MESDLSMLSSVDLLSGIIIVIIEVVVSVYHSGPHNPLDSNEYTSRAWCGALIMLVGLLTFKCIKVHHRSQADPHLLNRNLPVLWSITVLGVSLLAVGCGLAVEILCGMIIDSIRQSEKCSNPAIPHACTTVTIYNAILLTCGTIAIVSNSMKIYLVIRNGCRRDGYVQLA